MTLEERCENATDEELAAWLEDAEGESGSCSDDDCSCHRAMWPIRDEIEWRKSQ